MVEEIYNRQQMQEDMQRSSEFVDVFSKVVSGRAGYKTVVQVKPITIKCTGCGLEFHKEQKFCHNCGTKNEPAPGASAEKK